MDWWWWIPIGIVAWFAVGTVVALWLGRVLRSCSQAREALDVYTPRSQLGPGGRSGTGGRPLDSGTKQQGTG